MDVTWIKRESIEKSEWFSYSFPEGGVGEPFIFPLLLYRYEEHFFLLDGTKRLALNIDRFPALYWSEDDLAPWEALILSLKANILVRGLNSVEKGKTVNIADRFFPEARNEILSVIGVGNREAKFLSRIDELDDDLKVNIARWKLPVKWTALICESAGEWNEIWKRISHLKISAAKMVYLVDSLREISHRSGRSPVEVIGEWDEGEDLFEFIDRIRYPVMHDIREKAENLRRRYLPRGIELTFPENLEGDEVKISLKKGKLRGNLEDVYGDLKKIFSDPDFEELFGKL